MGTANALAGLLDTILVILAIVGFGMLIAKTRGK